MWAKKEFWSNANPWTNISSSFYNPYYYSNNRMGACLHISLFGSIIISFAFAYDGYKTAQEVNQRK